MLINSELVCQNISCKDINCANINAPNSDAKINRLIIEDTYLYNIFAIGYCNINTKFNGNLRTRGKNITPAFAFALGTIPISSASHMSFPLLEIFLPTDNCPPVDIDPIDLINEQDRFVNLACPLSSKELLFVLSSSVNTRK